MLLILLAFFPSAKLKAKNFAENVNYLRCPESRLQTPGSPTFRMYGVRVHIMKFISKVANSIYLGLILEPTWVENQATH